MLKRKPKILTPEQAEEIRTKDFFDMILPGTTRFLSDHYIIAEIEAEFQKILKAVSVDNADDIDEEHIGELMSEKQRLTAQLEQYATMRQKRESAKSRLDEICTILDGLQNHPMEYDDKLVRQLLECVVVESKEQIKVVFIGGVEVEMVL